MMAYEQFVDDYLLVVENDQDAWTDLMITARQYEHNKILLSEELRDQWDDFIEQVATLVETKYVGVAGLMLRQIAGGWGSAPFDLIAKRIIESDKEILAYAE